MFFIAGIIISLFLGLEYLLVDMLISEIVEFVEVVKAERKKEND